MLALAVRKEKYSSQQDQWELVAVKADMWLQTQPLPPTTCPGPSVNFTYSSINRPQILGPGHHSLCLYKEDGTLRTAGEG